jgi:tetraacyldisaccharide 4'-kinase
VKRLDYYWYNNSPLMLLLLPVSWLFCGLVLLRQLAYRLHVFKTHHLAVPVIVVGNISVGGTGKTPLVMWLVAQLKQAGFKPGIVSRGYGGKARHWPQQVRPDSDATVVGDEAVMLAQRCQCPMAVGPDRVAAAKSLQEFTDCDVIVADDGLQHYALGRDVEIAVVDGVRRYGNGHCLPAGPLREPLSRLKRVDLVVSNGVAGPREYAMTLQPGSAVRLNDARQRKPLQAFAQQQVHAIAGIGNPQRFFQSLKDRKIALIEHPFADHHPFLASDINFKDGLPVLMTEKDAVKCRHFAEDVHWYVPVDVKVDERMLALLKRKISSSVA